MNNTHTTSSVAAPSEQFNFAQFLLERNAAHGERPAFIDDAGTLTYGCLLYTSPSPRDCS